MSFTSFLSNHTLVRDRGEWLAHLHLLDPDGVEELLRFARDNQGKGMATGVAAVVVGSTTIPAHTIFRKRVVKAPTVTQTLWQPGSLLGHTTPSFGEAVLNNRDGGLDQYRPIEGYTWVGRRCVWFFGDYDDLQDTVGVVFDGKLGQPAFSLGSVRVFLVGREGDFTVPTSTRVYRGSSYQLELTGDRTVSYGTPSPVNITGSMSLLAWLWIETAPTAATLTWGWVSAPSPWRLLVDTTGSLILRTTIGGGTESATSTATLGVKKPYHIGITVSGRTVVFYLWDEDTQTLTTETKTNVYSSATRDAAGAIVYAFRSGSDATYKIWGDEMMVFNTVLTADEIASYRHRPIPSGSIPAACVHYTKMDDGSGTTVTDSSATAANGTISGAGTSQWLWAMEGGPELAGTPKAEIWGKRFGVRPILVSPIHGVYQFAGGGALQSITTYEGGNGHTMASGYSTMRDLIVTAPAAGESKPYLARGYARLGSVPTLPVSALVEGYNTGGYVSTAGPITRAIITGRGPKLTDPTDLDTSSFTAYGTAASATIGVAIYNPNTMQESIAVVLDHVNAGAPGWWGYVGNSILFHVEKFTGPDVTADYTITPAAIVDIDEVHPPPPVIYEVVVKYRKNDVRLTEDQVAGAVKGTANWQQWTLDWLEKRDTDVTLKSRYAREGGQSLVIETPIYGDADAQALATSLLAVVKGVKEVWVLTLRATGLLVTVGSTVTILFEFQDGTTRFGLDGTKKFLVIATEWRLQEGKVVITVWG